MKKGKERHCRLDLRHSIGSSFQSGLGTSYNTSHDLIARNNAAIVLNRLNMNKPDQANH